MSCDKLAELFKDSSVDSYHPLLGHIKIYKKRDENLGRALLTDYNIVTPNMPKIPYFTRFKSKYEDFDVEIIPELHPDLKKLYGRKAYITMKYDGTNILFYRVGDKVIPKTRLNAIASRKVLNALSDNRFPWDVINSLVMDDFVPVIELWGTDVVEKYNLLNGGTNLKKFQDLFKYNSYNATVLMVFKADYDNCNYELLPPKKAERVINGYSDGSIDFAYVLDTVRVTYKNLYTFMKFFEDVNRHFGSNVFEGAVAHVASRKYGYKMFKIKPFNIMKKDVMVNMFVIPVERIQLEMEKIFDSFDIIIIAQKPEKYFNMLIEELESDYRNEDPDFHFVKRQLKYLWRAFTKRITNELIHTFPNITIDFMVKHRFDGRIIGEIKRRVNGEKN